MIANKGTFILHGVQEPVIGNSYHKKNDNAIKPITTKHIDIPLILQV